LKKVPVENATRIHFEETGATLTAVEIDHGGRSPVIAKLHRVLFALGIVVSSYQVRTVGEGIVERLVLQRSDGESVSGELGDRARAAVLPVALES
jgi:UTP:GlnB (protein PII) uridylyltransferase